MLSESKLPVRQYYWDLSLCYYGFLEYEKLIIAQCSEGGLFVCFPLCLSVNKIFQNWIDIVSLNHNEYIFSKYLSLTTVFEKNWKKWPNGAKLMIRTNCNLRWL